MDVAGKAGEPPWKDVDVARNAGELPWKAVEVVGNAGELPWKAGEFPVTLREKSGNAWLGEVVMLGNVCEEDMVGSKVCCEDGVRSVLEGNIGEEAELGNGLVS